MADLRTGTYGKYYGSPCGSSEPLTQAEMQLNAVYIYMALGSKGWTANAVAAILGNMQAESTINPGRWQGDNIGSGPAYGIVQWDPWSKYVDWCTEQGYTDPSEMDNNLARIQYELDHGGQWYATSDYDLTFQEFTTSTATPEYLAAAFVKNYERPADQSAAVLAARGDLAKAWYTYITGGDQPTPDPGGGGGSGTTRKRGKFKFLLFNRRRRMFT